MNKKYSAEKSYSVILDPNNNQSIINRNRNYFEKKYINFVLRREIDNKMDSTLYDENIYTYEKAEKISEKKITSDHSITANELRFQISASLKISSEWYNFDRLPELLDIEGTNFGELIKIRLADRLLNLFSNIDLAFHYFEEFSPNRVIIQSDLYPIGQAFNLISSSLKKETFFIEPILYRELKKRFSLFHSHNWWKAFRSSRLFRMDADHPNNNEKVLVDTPYINYYRSVSPVIDVLSERYGCQCYILGKGSFLSNDYKPMSKLNISNSRRNTYKAKYSNISKYFRTELINNDEFQNIFNYKHINILSAIRNELEYYISREYFDYVESQLAFNKILDTLNPDVLLIGSESRADGTAGHALLAKLRGIPIIEVQHGVFSMTPVIFNPISDIICVGGEYYKEIISQCNISKDKIIITGWPKFDRYRFLNDTMGDKQGKIFNILFATQGLDVRINLECVKKIGLFLRKHPGSHLVIKPHPVESASIYRPLSRMYKQIILKESTDDIAKLIVETDLVILVSSTAGIEAILSDKPIVCINLSGKGGEEYISKGVAIEVKELAELIPAIENALFNDEKRRNLSEARKKFIEEYAYKKDGKSAERVADIIYRDLSNMDIPCPCLDTDDLKSDCA